MHTKSLWKNRLALIIPFGILIMSFSVSAKECSPKGDTYCNPLGEVTDITQLTAVILKYLLQLTVPLAGLGIIIAGLYYVFASVSGNPGKTTQARKTFTYVVIGSLLVVGANALALAVINFLKGLP